MAGTPDDNLHRFRSAGHVTVVSAEAQQIVRVPVAAIELMAGERTTLRAVGVPTWCDPESVRSDLRLLHEHAAVADRSAVEIALSEVDHACRYGTGVAIVPPSVT